MSYRKMKFNLLVEVLLREGEMQFYFHDMPPALFELIPLKPIAGITRPPGGWYKDKEFTFNRKKIVLVFYQGKDGKP